MEDEREAFERADADMDMNKVGAATGDGLDEYEWLGFWHPELSKIMLREMAQEIMNSFGLLFNVVNIYKIEFF